MFVRRHYYDRASGATVCSYLKTGDVSAGSVARDYAFLPELTERSPENTGVFEWLCPDEATEANFKSCDGVRVEDGKLVFFTKEYPYTPSYEELMQAYQIMLGGDADA